MTMPMILAGLLGLSILLVFIGLTIPGQPNRVQARLQTYGSRPLSLAEMELEMPFSERVALPMIRGMSNFISRFAPQRNIEETKLKLEMAGNPNDWTTADFLGVRGILGLILAILVLVTALLVRVPTLQLVVAVAAAGFLGFELPVFWLNYKIGQRKHDIQKALPDALDLLTISVEAGLGFDAAMLKVAEKSDTELSRAFARVNAEIRVGKLRRDALRDMAHRSGVPDVTNFIAAVIQADQLGVSMAKVLRIQSEQMRIKRRQRAEELAAQAPVKMMFPLVFLIFPSILIVLLGPAVIIFYNRGLGV
jgi:tight adherence protein C